jgi:hypothetical protein
VQYNNTPENGEIDHAELRVGERWFRYEGFMDRDQRHGFGKLLYTDGSYYQGEFRYDYPEG